VPQLHAIQRSYPIARITYTRGSGATGVLSLTHSHYVHVLVGQSLTVGQTSATVNGFGDASVVPAGQVTVGNLIPAAVSTAVVGAAAQFEVVRVTSIQNDTASGVYSPLVETSYIIADGAVAPLGATVGAFPNRLFPGDAQTGAKFNYWIWSASIPIFTKSNPEMPIGTPAKTASWNGAELWPGIDIDMRNTIVAVAAQGRTSFNASNYFSWFESTYAAWLADRSVPVPLASLVAVFDASCVAP
jgi:hypothetical protein